MKASLRMALAEYKRWLFNPRILILFMLLVYSRESIGKLMCNQAVEMNCNLNIFEPYIGLCNSYIAVLIVPVFFLVMMSDFPVMEGSYMWSVLRMGKKNWIFSQIFFCVMSSFTIEIFLFISSVLSCLGHIGFSSGWSDVVTKYYISFPEKAGIYVNSLIQGDIYNQMTSARAFLLTISLTILSMVMYGVILMCGKIYGKRYLAYVICVGLIGIGAIGKYLGTGVQWLLPASNCAVSGHYMEYVRESQVSFTYSYVYFIVVILLITVISYLGMKRRNICREL